MASKLVFVLCAFAVVKSISAQCIGSALAAEELALANGALAYGPGFAANGLAYGAPYGAYAAPGYGLNAFVPKSGGSFLVTSTSPIAPTGIAVISENAIEGALSIIGELPFLGAVAVEGALPSSGAGGINYGCGTGVVGIVSEGVASPYGPAGPAGVVPGRYGYGPGVPAPGLPVPGIAYNARAPGLGFGPLY